MTQFHALTPKQAIEMIQAAGVEDAARLIRDHAAAGLVKTYAQVQVSIPTTGERTIVRDAALSPSLWERMIDEGVDADAWSGGTVRLGGSQLIGGLAAVHVTGISFNPAHIARLADLQHPRAFPGLPTSARSHPPTATPAAAAVARRSRRANPSAIPDGALLCTIAEAGEALGVGRTTINKLISSKKLVRVDDVAGVRLTVASVQAAARDAPL